MRECMEREKEALERRIEELEGGSNNNKIHYSDKLKVRIHGRGLHRDDSSIQGFTGTAILLFYI